MVGEFMRRITAMAARANALDAACVSEHLLPNLGVTGSNPVGDAN